MKNKFIIHEIAHDKTALVAAKKHYLAKIKHNKFEVFNYVSLIQCMCLLNKAADTIEILKTIPQEIVNTPAIIFESAKVYHLLNNLATARNYYAKIFAEFPQHLECVKNLAILETSCNNLDDAINYYRMLIKLEPDNTLWYNNTIELCLKTINYQLALTIANQAYARFKSIESMHNLAVCYYKLQQYSHSAIYFTKILQNNPYDIQVIFSLGVILQEQGYTAASRQKFKQAWKLFINKYTATTNKQELLNNVSYFKAQGIIWYAKMCLDICDWQELASLTPMVEKIIEHQLKNKQAVSISAFLVPALIKDANLLQLQIAKYQADQHQIKTRAAYTDYVKLANNHRIKIAYLSPNFNYHAVGLLLADIFKYHDRDKFEVTAYSIHTVYDSIQQTIASSCDKFVDLSKLSDIKAAERIYNDGIEILVDLAGYTDKARTNILSLQPAPKQIHFLGQVGTMGADYIQYHVADKVLIPEQDSIYYTEKILYLSSQIAVRPFVLPDEIPSPRQYNLPADAFVFCCFNAAYRLDKLLFSSWMQILINVPNAVLWLVGYSTLQKKNLLAEAKRYAVANERIIFKSPGSLTEDWHIRLADVYLDSFCITACTPAIIALMANVPVITLQGSTAQSRQCASLVSSANMPELITTAIDDYIQTAINLALQADLLAAYKANMSKRVLSSPLFNQPLFIKNLEEQLTAIRFAS